MATKTERSGLNDLIAILERFHWDMGHTVTRNRQVPDEWRDIWQNRSKRKRKVSLYLDEDVYRLFRSMGAGMGPRMNLVLCAFARARLAGLLEGEDLAELYRKRWMGRPKPSVEEILARLEGPSD